ncbi:MAG TPA: hypothetical protein V6C86_22840 [Oculatellaceae cyanobacterium]
MNKVWQVACLSLLLSSTVALSLNGCSSSRQERIEHYVSPQVQGEAQKINLEEVQKAFWDSKGSDFNSWMGAFEKRVNEIYDGKEVVSIDATRKEGRLIVTGYIDNAHKEGFQPGDEKLFTIEQTGDATEDKQLPYRVSDYRDRPYYEGRHSFLDNPFLQAMIISHFMSGGWGGHYYTPYPTINVLHTYRDGYRGTPQYTTQQASNQSFFSRFKSNPNGGLQSSKSFGSSPFTSTSTTTTSKRSWFGGSNGGTTTGGSSSGLFTSGESTSTSAWGGRRSSGSSLFGGSRSSSRSWGGFRRR